MELTKQWRDHFKQLRAFDEAISLLYWDMRTQMPEQSAPLRAETIGYLSTEAFKRQTSDSFKQLLDEMEAANGLTATEKRSLQVAKTQYERNAKIPASEYQAYVTLVSEAETAWEKAKEQNDWGMFAPFLKKILTYQRKFADYFGYDAHPYDALLYDFEPGMTVAQLDDLFETLRDELVPLIRNLPGGTASLDWSMNEKAQERICHDWMRVVDYDLSRGRLDATVHPFEITINRRDVRITTKYDEADFRNALFGTMHEAGHATYEQQIDESLDELGLGGGASMGIHESQSLFFENFVGRSIAFLKSVYPNLQAEHHALQDVDFETFYAGVNEAKPSLIRIEADELTYSLHIIIRYELEKALIQGDLSVDELPAAWNKLYKEYLGVDVPSDAKGVLQDVHWAGGSFGYFPSYALGLIYAAQLTEALKAEHPDFETWIATGEFTPIKQWLETNVHRHGKTLTPNELIRTVTGADISVRPLVRYLTSKYGTA
ncbi:carboxypeptidase M32 [Exiguobacterium aurantiacum]|uniref:Metal-dependent carboxypeptidase n=1 Tax=Exiguobacterium aurantiacum TaxID=33987 RepID=A0A377FUF3_9BACL|nr:carboxypeptidase M32 [Exiguobacterium aurantiacum]STO08095.1 Putative metalloprotease ypwA [Exiguobacterium aurantiacum]